MTSATPGITRAVPRVTIRPSAAPGGTTARDGPRHTSIPPTTPRPVDTTPPRAARAASRDRVTDAATTDPPALELSGLVRRFGATTAVAGIDLAIRQGEIFGLLGPNGAGKTTTIRMIAGLLPPTAGNIRIHGTPLTQGGAGTRTLVGVCPQENVVYPELTIRENLDYAARLYKVAKNARRARIERLLSLLGLHEKSDTRADRLSGGMRRRLAIALALVHDPPVVILDEPEAGLDPQSRVAVRRFIRTIAQDKTVLLTSHNMDEVERLADRVAIIDHGRVIAVDTPQALKARVGDGDHIEFHVGGEGTRLVAAALRPQTQDLRVDGNVVTVRGHGLMRRFGSLVGMAEGSGADLRDVRFRGTTLEDVFLHLTGRRLRE